jgi:hypothetical protein
MSTKYGNYSGTSTPEQAFWAFLPFLEPVSARQRLPFFRTLTLACRLQWGVENLWLRNTRP